MKKLYMQDAFIRFNNRRSRRTMERRTKYKVDKKNIKFNVNHHRKKYTRLTAPETFSIVQNSNPTIVFLAKIADHIHKKHPVYIDLQQVKIITPDAILYLLLLIQEAEICHIPFKGNAPQNRNSFTIFISSGFYNYVKSNINKSLIPNNENILKIKKGKEVSGEEAEKIQSFVNSHVKNVADAKLKALYSILIECMSNTNEYAGNELGIKDWWTMALHDKESDKVLFAFVDNGVGIPTTVRKKWTDTSSDAELLEKAASGTYQMSGSKEKTRNKGLPQIRKFQDDNFIQSLVFVSNNGYYSVKDKDTKKLENRFIGSIIAWEFA